MVRKVFATSLIAIGACLILISSAWFGYLRLDSARAERTAEKTVRMLSAAIAEVPAPTEIQSTDRNLSNESYGAREMKTWEENGIFYLGILEIPDLDLMLPVISQWSEEYAKLAPCRYAGDLYSGDLVLCAHNYESHFGKLADLRCGDRVHFTDVEGNCHIFEVTETETLGAGDTDRMMDGNWELTLFTCTYGGSARFTVRCRRISQ